MNNHRRFRKLPFHTLVIAALATVSVPAYTATWVTVVPDKKARVEVDSASIERGSDGKLRVWHRESYSPKKIQDAWAFSYATMKQLSELQCEKRLAAPLRRIYFGDGGAEIKTESFDGKDVQPVVPDSAFEHVFNHACKPKKEAAVEPPKPPPPPPPVDEKKKKKKKGEKDEPPPAPPPPPPPKPPTPWAYDGKLGPAHWGKLDPDYAVCSDGKRQSPIDLRGTIGSDLPPIRIGWQTIPLAITDTGHEIRVDASGGGKIIADGEEFEFLHFDFRLPAEEMVNGKRAAMGVQFVHQSKTSGRYAIIAVPLAEGKENRLIRTLWNAMPLEQGKTITQAALRIDPGELMPPKREYITYAGSLTTPPCTENVLWLVMKHPVTLSKEQIADFAKVYKNNVRPAQPANGRVIKESRTAPANGKR